MWGMAVAMPYILEWQTLGKSDIIENVILDGR